MAYIGTKPANQITDSTLIADGTVTPADLSTGAPVWNTSGNVGIGITNPSSYNAAGRNLVIGTTSNADSGITVASGTTATGYLLFADGTSGSDAFTGYIGYNHGSNYMQFHTNGGVERMRIDSAGRVTTPFQPAFAACGSATAVTTSSASPMQFNTLVTALVGSARSSGYNTSTFRFTAPVAGLYGIHFIYYANAGGGYAQIAPYKNGAIIPSTDQLLLTNTNGTNAQMTTSSYIIELAVNDFVDIRPRAGYSTTMFGGHSLFTGYLIG